MLVYDINYIRSHYAILYSDGAPELVDQVLVHELLVALPREDPVRHEARGLAIIDYVYVYI